MTDKQITSFNQQDTKGSLTTALTAILETGEQEWCSGKSTSLPPTWPGFDSRSRRHMWAEFVVGSLLALRDFSPGTPVFLSSPKPTILIPIRSGKCLQLVLTC